MTSKWGWRAELREFVAWVGYRKRRHTALNPRTGHWIKPTIDAGMGVTMKVICHEPVGAECRQVIVRPAEMDWRALRVTPAVTEDGGYCQWVDWFVSVGDEAAFYEGPDNHRVAEGPISIRWESSRGDDDSGSFNWMYVDG